ncbi:ATP-binding response regulator [Pyrinomonas methylaliphatogenes]|jgi:anti-sigma regulatory factor (Ser/Thr protein kinase)|uniref:Response regulator with CheY-like receiver, AAA-type ATPase, and DNA-binding domains n=1 Tax=Pyrinomonas methylaliphatogenes TaxID=454194 RepID=A0A0B6WYK3_9BACT|nr:ATP-binding protein [Pyrinomonas methylaliphatogenes]MBX5477810.1 ATP-binding protein [Pyrinomonas methylaliphatogenes]CDM66348.1 response regulator with CheY-like receiver, AAA-type ATPase, and DNA-binding domains [Pyrinomonas methylaliphatogenes]
MGRRRILIVESDGKLRQSLERALEDLGHDVVATSNRREALARDDLEDFDLIISDLTEDAEAGAQILSELERKGLPVPVVVSASEGQPPSIIEAFRLGATNYLRRPYDREELRQIVEKTLAYKLRFLEDRKVTPYVRERIEFELPSDLSLMGGVLQYLLERAVKLGIIRPERSNLFVALDEAIANAIIHGNKSDPQKMVHIIAELTPREARFTIEDEGEGFDRQQIPDPRDPANLFKPSGRGVLLISNIMDEVEYNERGNRLTMVKRAEDVRTLARDDERK